MSQYKEGTITATKNSATIVGAGTSWLSEVEAGDAFIVVDEGVIYDVASIESDTELSLSTTYKGNNKENVGYTIARDFTSPSNIPELDRGSLETAAIFTRAMRQIQTELSSLSGISFEGQWVIGAVYSKGSVVIYSSSPGTASIVIALEQHTADSSNEPGAVDSVWEFLFDETSIDTIVFAEMNYRGEWEPDTEYFEQNVVRHNQSIYVAPSPFVSGTTFNPLNWEYLIDIDELQTYKDLAEAAATAASTSETNALSSESAAATSETNAADSASAALTSEQNAASSESNASTSASAALLSEQNAATSESNASDSASAASTSETNASNSADAALASENAAATSESNSLASENKAEQWADAPLGTEVEPSKYSARHWAEQLGAIPETAYNWQGDWVAGTYNAGDAVYHVATRSAYITLVETSEEPSFTATDWQLLARGSESTFSELTDTPNSYAGEAGKFPQVNTGENALEFNGDVYTRENILGAVSELGGVPTGAIIERGSNSNGEYVKFADGTMICYRRSGSLTANTTTSSFVSANIDWAASFIDPPKVSCPAEGDNTSNVRDVVAYNRDASSSGTRLLVFKLNGEFVSTSTVEFFMIAIGRWF